MPGEYAVSDLLVERVGQLRKGDRAELATFTFSGDSPRTGGAAPLLKALDKALGRGAAIHFVADRGIATTNSFLWGLSLAGLAARPYNPLELTISPGKPLMHHKAALSTTAAARNGSSSAPATSPAPPTTASGTSASAPQSPTCMRPTPPKWRNSRRAFWRGQRPRPRRRRIPAGGFRGDCWVRFGPPLAATNGTENAERKSGL
jgi:hypothetical protein